MTKALGLFSEPLISNQVNRSQIKTILRELEGALALGKTGAVVEFGCYIGTTSLFIRRILDQLNDRREFHVYDSFVGLPAKATQDASGAGAQFIAGELAASKKQLLNAFHKANLKPPIIHKAWFDELLSKDVPAKIVFAFLDGDFYDSICSSLALVLPRMASGSVIVIDDYAREALPGVAKAVAKVAPHLIENVKVEHNLGIIHL